MGVADEVISERVTMDGIEGGGIWGKLGVNTGPQPRFMSPTSNLSEKQVPLPLVPRRVCC